MRRGRRLTVASAVCVAALFLTGCHADPAPVAPPPAQTDAPVFATEEEALEAAVAAYEAYNETFNAVARDGGAGADRIAAFVTEAHLPAQLDGFQALTDSGRRLVGHLTVDEVTLQQVYVDSDWAEVILYVCLDTSQIQIVDENGSDVTPDELTKPWPREVALQSSPHDPKQLLMSGDEYWPSHGMC